MPLTMLREFFRLEAAGGIILIFAAICALIVVNTPAASLYDALLGLPAEVRIGALSVAKPLLLWINDGLMAVFFLLVGLEIKREMLRGELASREQIMLPGLCAVGGMVVPALIYAAFNAGDAQALRGWAIPAATDIAFALGVLSLLGSRVPLALKVFLTAVAVLDDLGAIIVIALFYTENLSVASLALAGLLISVLVGLNIAGVRRLAPYMLVGLALWVCVLKSGVHATLAGVVIGLTVPLHGGAENEETPLERLEHALHPWVAFGILPVFAFANAGVPLAGLSLAALTEGVSLGIAAGLFFGKQIGILGAAWLAVRLRVARLPEGADWRKMHGVALLCAIGFTMSLFIGTLAFDTADEIVRVRIGVLSGSIVSAIAGYVALFLALRASGAVTRPDA
jgi:NhaA family Na+:H+ antiporter